MVVVGLSCADVSLAYASPRLFLFASEGETVVDTQLLEVWWKVGHRIDCL